MDLENIKDKIKQWAASEHLVRKAYIFGSRSGNDWQEDSDLDVAIELNKEKGDENTLTTWVCEGKRLEENLQKILPYKVQLELLGNNETPTIKKGIEESSILVYSEEDET